MCNGPSIATTAGLAGIYAAGKTIARNANEEEARRTGLHSLAIPAEPPRESSGQPTGEGWVQGLSGPRRETAGERQAREKMLDDLDKSIAAQLPPPAKSKGAPK